MNYRISGLDPDPFTGYRHKTEQELTHLQARRVVADGEDSYPCRISLMDAKVGDTLILLNFEHLPLDSPYRSRHAIYINEASTTRGVFENAVPAQQQRRLLSVRGFDAAGMIVDAEVVEGIALEEEIARQFSNAEIQFLHVHNARRGCYAARVDRLDAPET